MKKRDPASYQLMKDSNSKSSASTTKVCKWLYSAGAATVASSAAYFGSVYYITTTQKILTQQIPSITHSGAIDIINTLGVTGTSIRYIAQMSNLVNKLHQLVQTFDNQHRYKKTFKVLATLTMAGCAGIGAYMLTAIQADEYEFKYNPTWFAVAIPLVLGGMEAIEATLGGLDVDHIKKLFSYLKGMPSDNLNLNHLTINDAADERVQDFPSRVKTSGIIVAGSMLILFSFATVIDEFRRNVLLGEEDNVTLGSSIGFTVGLLGNVLQMLLDLEKLSEISQQVYNKRISIILGGLSFLFASTSSSLSFIMGYEFGETCQGDHETRIALGTLASLPKIVTAFMFINPALEYTTKISFDALQKIKRLALGSEENMNGCYTALLNRCGFK